jgi:hypothetical protein
MDTTTITTGLKLDLDSLDGFQRELHITDKELRGDKSEDTEEITSRFSAIFKKTTWSSHGKIPMDVSVSEGKGKDNEKIFTFTSSRKFDFLFKSEVKTYTPELKVKPEYKEAVQICWTPKFGHNYTPEARLTVDDDPMNSMDSIWLDMHSQLFMKPGAGKRKTYNEMIGNIPILTEWSTYLPRFPIGTPQPWFYSWNTGLAIPTLTSMNTINHIYTARTSLGEMLRMRVKKNDEYIEIKYNPMYLENPQPIPPPELWGRYAIITKQEREWHKSLRKTLYINDIISYKSNNPINLGSIESLDLNTQLPTKAIFWVAENNQSRLNRNYSNYTTDPNNINLGWNPCLMSGISYRSGNKVQPLYRDHFDLSEAFNFFPSCPDEPGYNAVSICYEPDSIGSDVSIILGKLDAKLNVTLGDSDPFNTNMVSPEVTDEQGKLIPIESLDSSNHLNTENKPKFILHARLLVIKRLSISYNESTQKMMYTLSQSSVTK